MYLSSILFAVVFFVAIGLFTRNIRRIIRNINLGRKIDRSDQKLRRWKYMARVALGQSKMTVRPIAGLLHLIVYVGFIVINIELIEIVLDGFLGTHRVLSSFLGGTYDLLIATFEIFALLVILSVLVFWFRRNAMSIRRFWKPEMKGWPKKDADYILYFELVLMFLFLTMNASDYWLQLQPEVQSYYTKAGSFPVSSWITPLFDDMSYATVVFIERTAWWLHIVGILAFLNYLYYSKHLHIILAFPNTFYANLNPLGRFSHSESISNEVKLMIDPSTDPYTPLAVENEPLRFGASDVNDLNRVQLMNAYSCTECGRCTDVCPANQTGKKLSPRKIMMDTRDRLEQVGKNLDRGLEIDNNTLLDNYISREELWACTTCNACVEACPISIDPLSIIMDMRQFLVLEQSSAPKELNTMMANIENNGSPWPFNQQDRFNWSKE